MLNISQKQLDKHNALCKKFENGPKLGDFSLVAESEAQAIEAVYGPLFVHIATDGSSHT